MSRTATIWTLAFPIILSNITVPLLGAVDAAVMGHMDSAAYLGAVAVGALIFDYLFWSFGFLRQATTGLVAQALGARDGTEARAIFIRAALIAIVAGLIIWALQVPVFALARSLLPATQEVENLARIYFNIRIWSAPADLMNYVLIGWILANKDTTGVLIQQVITNLINVGLDLWFVWGLGYGVEGVAAASVIAQYSGLVIGLLVLHKNLMKIDGRWQFKGVLGHDKMIRLFSLNFDIFVRTVCLLTAFAWFTAQGAKLGNVILAANAILLQFQQFTSYALDGFAHAVEILSGHSKGAKERAEFRGHVKTSTLYAGLCAIGFGLVYALSGTWLIGLFSDLPNVIETANDYRIWMVVLPLASVWSFQLDGIYFGLTETRSLRNMMIVCIALYIPLSLFLLNFWGNHGLWAAFTIFMLLRAITLGMIFPRVEQKAFA